MATPLQVRHWKRRQLTRLQPQLHRRGNHAASPHLDGQRSLKLIQFSFGKQLPHVAGQVPSPRKAFNLTAGQQLPLSITQIQRKIDRISRCIVNGHSRADPAGYQPGRHDEGSRRMTHSDPGNSNPRNLKTNDSAQRTVRARHRST